MASYMNCFYVDTKTDANGDDVFYVRDKNLERTYGRSHVYDDAKAFADALNAAYSAFINIPGNTVSF